MISLLRRQFLPLCLTAAFAAYGYFGNGTIDSPLNIPAISGNYEQMANEAALRNALFPNQPNQFSIQRLL